jgi:hypothetical protein
MLFAKISGSSGAAAQHRIIASSEESLEQFNFYQMPNIHQQVRFDPDRKLESDQWYYVELTPEQTESMLSPYLNNESSSADLNKTVQSDYDVIETVYRVDAGKAIFTKITDSYRIRNKMILKFHDTEQAEIIQEANSIEFNGDVHAYYDGANKLYFRNFGKIRSMFPGIEEFYRKATQAEKQRFVDNAIFHNTGVDVDTIGQIDSRRIATVLGDLSIDFENEEKHPTIISAANHYADLLSLEVNENKITLNDKSDVTKALKVLLGRYYVSEITGQRMESYGSSTLEG